MYTSARNCPSATETILIEALDRVRAVQNDCGVALACEARLRTVDGVIAREPSIVTPESITVAPAAIVILYSPLINPVMVSPLTTLMLDFTCEYWCIAARPIRPAAAIARNPAKPEATPSSCRTSSCRSRPCRNTCTCAPQRQGRHIRLRHRQS